MGILPNFILALSVILNSMGISSGMPPRTRDFLQNFGIKKEHMNDPESSSQSDCLPNSDHTLNVSRCGTSQTSDIYSQERSLPLAGPHSSAENLFPAEPFLRARFRSPPARQRPSKILGIKIEELRLVRFISKRNANLKFEIRKYTFPPDEAVQIRTKEHALGPIPYEEKLVLSNPNGEVFAILEQHIMSKVYFRGIYKPVSSYLTGKRVKINMDNGKVTELTRNEIVECPIGQNKPILKNFELVRV